MPISKSAKKALRSAEKKASVNRHRKEVFKSALKKVSAKTLRDAISAIDKAAKQRIIHKNKAARLKSRLSTQFKGAAAAKTSSQPAEKPVSKTKSSAVVKKPVSKVAKKAPVKKAAKAVSKTKSSDELKKTAKK